MRELNKEQAQAVYSTADKLLCLAGAGTGKTFSMISRIIRLVEEGADPSSILVLTFTNAAAFEMKERYLRADVGGRVPEFRTFHSFCYHILATDSKIRAALGYSTTPSIADGNVVKRIQSQAKLQSNIKMSDRRLKEADKSSLSPAEKFEYELYKKTESRIMKSEGLITFDVLCKSICKLFSDDSPIVESYKDRYKYLFVDEFQDTDITQFKFVTSFTDAQIFVVGDALQSIYSFRGADSSIIKSLADNKEWTTVKLSHNYRSTEEICEFANKNSTYADPLYRVSIQGHRSGEVVHRISKVSEDMRDIVPISVLDSIHQILQTTEGRTSAVLCRTNAEVSFVSDYLRDHNILHTTSNQDEENSHLLHSAVDDTYMLNWLSTFLDSSQYAEYIRMLAWYGDTDSEEPDRLSTRFIEVFGNKYAIHIRLDKILEIRKILYDTHKATYLKCVNILEILGIENIVVDTDAESLPEISEYLLNIVNTTMESNIYVGTIHSVKGLEYDTVFLVNVGGTSFRLNTEDNRNLYYVGITRAQNRLYIYGGDTDD